MADAPSIEIDRGLRQHMLRVFNYMAGGLAVTGLVAAVVASSPAMYGAIFGTPLKWVVILAPLGFVFFLSLRLEAISAGTAQLLYWLFCVAMGLSMASIFLVFTGTSIARAFFIAAAMFGATSLYGYTTGTDLSRFGPILFMGLIGLILAMLVNLFLGSSTLQFAISIIGVVIFTGLTAYDVQMIRRQYVGHMGVEPEAKLAVLGALRLYLNFINLFQLLLQLTGQRRE
jgi:FtsH-binding integral membrane protein